jgi:2,4-dienoyl-CoA reductase-like NADH-dependent reductase (Old Yellow Enzyme family)
MPPPLLFQPISFRSITARNRVVVSPMCQYSASDGLGNDWHVQNLGAKAAGGAGIVFTEATHVSVPGRITHHCLGLWNDAHRRFLARLAALIQNLGAVPGIQLAHSGRKGSSHRPWEGGAPIPPDQGGWVPLAPSPIPFHEGATEPHALSTEEIAAIVGEFARSARMAREAGFKIIEVHAAHGYLVHEFLSPITNRRRDAYGGDLARRARMLMETISAIRSEWPEELPLFVRLSCSDWMPGGLSVDDAVEISRWLAERGDVDLIDCSSGGIAPGQRIPALYPGYQVPFAEAVRSGARIATGAVGLITEPTHAAEILGNGRADLVFLARALLADPAWPLRAAKVLGVKPELPPQYQRAAI